MSSGGIRILVTGAAGFLGWTFVKMMVDEPRCADMRQNVLFIRCLDMKEPPFKQLKNENRIQLEFIQADITDPIAVKEATKGINSIFHFAAAITINTFVSEEFLTRINFGGTKNLVEAGIENGVDRFLYASTLEVVYNDDDMCEADETWPLRGRSPYSRSKIRSEKFLKEMEGKETKDGKKFKTVVIRPLGMYGENDPYIVKNLLLEAKSGRLICRLGNGSAKAQYIYVGNMAYGFMVAHERLGADPSRISGQVFFIADDTKPVNLFEFGRPFLELKGYQVPKLYIPYAIALVIAFILQVVTTLLRPLVQFESAINVTTAKSVCSIMTVNSKKSRELLNYKPLYSYEEGMQRALDYWKTDHRFDKTTK